MQSMMVLCLCLALSLITLASCKKAAAEYHASDGAIERLENLKALAARSSNGMIELDDSTYEYFAIDKPRDYNLFIFLTANHPRYKCTVCPETDQQVTEVAKEYGNTIARSATEKDTFFVKVDFEKAHQVFTDYQLQTVPIFFYVSKRDSMGDGKSIYDIPIRERYAFPEATTVDTIAEWVSFKSGTKVVIPKSMFMVYTMTILLFAGLAALVPSLINSLDTFWLPLVQSKKLWIAVSGIVYLCSVSGLMFDIIRDAPWYYNDPRGGGTYYFYPDANQQFVLEGFIVGFLNVACAAALLWTVIGAPKLKTAESRFIGITGGVMTFCALFWQVRHLYIMKNKWYGKDM